MSIRSSLLRAFHLSGYSLVGNDRLASLLRLEADMGRIATMSDLTRHRMIDALPGSRAQLKQDVFALCQADFRGGGFFVEFGATDGVTLSNTFLLETRFGWRGILAEPARCWHDALRRNRGCAIETACVWSASGERLDFAEVSDEPELSTIRQFKHGDAHGATRDETSTNYAVDTISLLDLLAKHDAPRVVDYLSIDVEGSEWSILSSFDFAAYDVATITVEHNFTPMRERIHALLSNHGYERRFTELSRWDDWYVKLR